MACVMDLIKWLFFMNKKREKMDTQNDTLRRRRGYIHGDLVLVERLPSDPPFPENMNPIATGVIKGGTQLGHSHRVLSPDVLFEYGEGKKCLIVKKVEEKIVHEEHGDVVSDSPLREKMISTGEYYVGSQGEYRYGQETAVLD